jgi:hypothetical protein
LYQNTGNSLQTQVMRVWTLREWQLQGPTQKKRKRAQRRHRISGKDLLSLPELELRDAGERSKLAPRVKIKQPTWGV